MKRVFACTGLLSLVLGIANCSSASTDPSSAVAEPTPALAPSEFTDANAALAEGTHLLDIGETDRAIEVLNRAVELDPDLGDAYFQLGIAYALVEARDAAVVEEQVTPTPVPGEKKQRVATTNSEKAFEKAVAAYQKQIDANENDHHAYYNLGRAYNKLNEDEDAAKALKQAVKLNPEDTEYQTELGAILVKLAQYREAIAPLKKAVELDPENSRAIDLLEDAEAGRRRVDYATKNTNKNANTAKANANSNVNSNAATAPQTDANKPKPMEVKPPNPAKTAAPSKPN